MFYMDSLQAREQLLTNGSKGDDSDTAFEFVKSREHIL